MADIIAGRKATGKFFYQYGFGEKLSSVAQKRLTEIICGLAMKGNQSRTTDFAELKQGFRTSYGHFLSKGKFVTWVGCRRSWYSTRTASCA